MKRKTNKSNINFQVGDLIKHYNDAIGNNSIYLVVASDKKCITIEYYDRMNTWDKVSYSIAEASSYVRDGLWQHFPVK
jgi:hypothetical protein